MYGVRGGTTTSAPRSGHGPALPRPPRRSMILISDPAVNRASRPADSLRSPLTADPETKGWLVIGEAKGKWSGGPVSTEE